MLKNKIAIGAVAGVLASGLFAFNILTSGSIKGTIMPVDAGSRAWALSPTDTFRATITQGAYEIPDVKPGAYRIIIEGKPPFKNAAKDSVRVLDGQATEVGEIRLEQ